MVFENINNIDKDTKIAVLVSGGVDSSVALSLLKEQGYTNITAFYLKIWLEDELSFLGTCPWQEDLSFVEAVCKKLNVPLEILSLQQEYWRDVVSYTLSEVKAGRTPNPDILCNSRIKFGAFINKISKDYKYIASGHYAQVEKVNNLTYLCTAKDSFKDQTYFLSYLNQEQLCRVMFPIGHLLKSEVRALAQKFDLPNKSRKDSQGICFLGKLKFSEFIEFHLGNKTGKLIEFETNQIVGEHNGFWFYTLGQRQGIGLSGGPWYVVSKDVDKNIVYISKNYETEEKSRNEFMISNINWIPNKSSVSNLLEHLECENNSLNNQENKQDYLENLLEPKDINLTKDINLDLSKLDFAIKLRHGPKFNQAKIKALDSSNNLSIKAANNSSINNSIGSVNSGFSDSQSYEVILSERDHAIVPGQFAVLYSLDRKYCLGGAIITG